MTEADLAALMRQYEALVWTVVSGILRSRRDCEEASADVFITLWNNRETFDPDDPGVKSYIITLARRRAIDRLRAEARHNADPLDELDGALSAESPESEVSDRLNAQIIAGVITSLPPPDAEIFTRRYYYSQPVKQIAAAMGLKPSYVKSRLERAKEEIRRRLLANNIIL
ncbi:MAG: sigma-70 family RNA polymerase sigma factor [Clostridia bacterium]|nr:sigma-70 family RNA polymerase sigma factor [Clostridia bacterium]